MYSLGRRQFKIGSRNIGHYIAEGYDLYETKLEYRTKRYLIRVRDNESKDHAFLCWYTERLLKKLRFKPKINTSYGADLEISHMGKRICFEIETGKRLDRMKRRDMYIRFAERAKIFDSVFIVVPNERIARRYRGFGFIVITKAGLEAFILYFSRTHILRVARTPVSLCSEA